MYRDRETHRGTRTDREHRPSQHVHALLQPYGHLTPKESLKVGAVWRGCEPSGVRFEPTSGFTQSDYTVFVFEEEESPVSSTNDQSSQSRCLEVPPTPTQIGAMQGQLFFFSRSNSGDESCSERAAAARSALLIVLFLLFPAPTSSHDDSGPEEGVCASRRNRGGEQGFVAVASSSSSLVT